MSAKKTLAVAALVLAASFAANALEGTVVSVSGKVEVQDGSMWIEVEKGDTIEKGAVLSTGFKSEAVISVKGSNFKLGPLTRITIEDLVSTGDKDSTQLYIDSGSIAANVEGQDGKKVGFKVRSAVATASVRGTSFDMNSAGRLRVTKGLVDFGPGEPKHAPSSSAVTAEEIAESADGAAEPPVADVPSTAASEDTAAATPAVATTPAEAPVPAPAPKSTVFTSTEEVGGSKGTPVFAGQTSKTNMLTGGQSKPSTEKAANATVHSATTETAASKEAVATSSAAPAPVPTQPAPAAKPSKGKLVVNVEYE